MRRPILLTAAAAVKIPYGAVVYLDVLELVDASGRVVRTVRIPR